MKLRNLAALIGALAITSAPFVLAVSGGGFPSNPQFSSVGVGTSASGVSGSVQASYVGVGRSASSGITRIVTDNGGSGDSEIVAGSTTAGDAYFRALAIGVTNWSFGVQRSTGKYLICNAVGITGTCAVLDSSGQFTSNSLTASNGNISATKSAGGVQVVATITDAVTNGVFSQGDFCNSAHCLHTLNTGTAQSSAFITNGVAGEAAYIYTDTAPLCLGTAANCRLVIDASGNITSPGAGTVPWQAKGTIGKCTAKFTMAGTGTPSLSASSTNCAGSTMSRTSVGSYTWTEANITFPSNIICTIDSSSSGPFVFVTSSSNGSAGVTILAVPGTASVLADPASGAHVTCSAGL